ncbi:hypothetical protein QVD17_15759 [Tagetes erecta]|uniref:Uncharacterized protein n=1 Tax=Tagetes erecta TaxID=13708 RepID=A0AAD8KTS0_TARER|nr:hypothetical protein QVD17_15759 [Tagetes erecta]
MSIQSQTTNCEPEDEQSVIDSIITATPPPPPTARIHKVPRMVRDSDDYDKYYVPKVVSIGPHHFRNPKLEFVQKLKPVFTMKLLQDEATLRSLYIKLGAPEMVKELRNFYEEGSTNDFRDPVFTKIMLLDSCFILYFIRFISGEKPENCQELKTHQIVFIHEDMFLLENQIPFKVLKEVMKLLSDEYCYISKIALLIYGNILAPERPKTKWFCIKNAKSCLEESKKELIESEPDHLLHLLHRRLTKKMKDGKKDFRSKQDYRCTFRNVNELMDVGIHFKPSETMSLAHIEFLKGKWWFSANVKLPPINVDDSTKPMLLNLVAYEMCSHDAYDAGVTSYICLLDSLIDHPEDVKVLRKAGVLENSLGSDKEVAKLFNEIGTDLVPNNLAYLEAKNMIQRHYKSRRNTLFAQLKHEYVKSPWAFLGLVGALIALFLTGVQTYFTVWSPKGDCDGLCKSLKHNHHL